MEKEFIPYDRALRLKALRFDEPCFGMYCEGRFHLLYPNSYKDIPEDFYREVDAPTFSQAFRWFRDKGYDVKVQKESAGLYFGFYWTGAAWIIVGNGSFEEAELACLDKLLEIAELKQKEDGK